MDTSLHNQTRKIHASPVLGLEFSHFTGLKIIKDSAIEDYRTVDRSWKERLFTLPWRPWAMAKEIHDPQFYQLGDTIVCSPASAERLRTFVGVDNAIEDLP